MGLLPRLRLLWTPARTLSTGAEISPLSTGATSILEFLKSVGNGVDAHAEKITKEFGDLPDFLVGRSIAFKKLGIPCKQLGLAMEELARFQYKFGTPERGMVMARTRAMSESELHSEALQNDMNGHTDG